MRPFPRNNVDQAKRNSNYRVSRARRCVECAFRIMTAKFQVIETPLATNIDTTIIIIKAICALYNITITLEGIKTDSQNQDNYQRHHDNVPIANFDRNKQLSCPSFFDGVFPFSRRVTTI